MGTVNRGDKMKKILIIPPDGNGSKGDEAMVRGAIELYYGSGDIKLLTPREALWKECILELSSFFEEEYCSLEELKNYAYDDESKLVIIGADLMDGLFFGETIECRLDAAQAAVDKGADVEIISCSFRDCVNEEIIARIKKQEGK